MEKDLILENKELIIAVIQMNLLLEDCLVDGDDDDRITMDTHEITNFDRFAPDEEIMQIEALNSGMSVLNLERNQYEITELERYNPEECRAYCWDYKEIGKEPPDPFDDDVLHGLVFDTRTKRCDLFKVHFSVPADFYLVRSFFIS
jgi:hypothetical protein